MNTITLKPAKDKSLVRRHPWIYANAIEHIDGKPAPGATVIVRAHDGRFLARASYSPHSQIRARVWSFDESRADRSRVLQAPRAAGDRAPRRR